MMKYIMYFFITVLYLPEKSSSFTPNPMPIF